MAGCGAGAYVGFEAASGSGFWTGAGVGVSPGFETGCDVYADAAFTAHPAGKTDSTMIAGMNKYIFCITTSPT